MSGLRISPWHDLGVFLVTVAAVLCFVLLWSLVVDSREFGWRSVPTVGDIVLGVFLLAVLVLGMVIDAAGR